MINDENEILGFLRFFSTKERLEEFISGDLYLNTPHYYRKLERLGMGDDFDACVAYHSIAKHGKLPKIVVNGKKLDINTATEMMVYLDEDKYDAYIQCWVALQKPESDEDLHSIQSDISRIRSEFGDHYAFLSTENFEAYLRTIWKAAKMPLRANLVSYNENRLQGSMFVKQSSYSYQREYRIAIGKIGKDVNEPIKLKVGNLSKLLQKNPHFRIKIGLFEADLVTPSSPQK